MRRRKRRTTSANSASSAWMQNVAWCAAPPPAAACYAGIIMRPSLIALPMLPLLRPDRWVVAARGTTTGILPKNDCAAFFGWALPVAGADSLRPRVPVRPLRGAAAPTRQLPDVQAANRQRAEADLVVLTLSAASRRGGHSGHTLRAGGRRAADVVCRMDRQEVCAGKQDVAAQARAEEEQTGRAEPRRTPTGVPDARPR